MIDEQLLPSHVALLRHIDTHVLPLIRLDFGVVVAALEAYCEGHHDAESVDRFLYIDASAQYFPKEVRSEIVRISGLLAVDVPRGDGTMLAEKRVNMLDVLLTLTVLVQGSLEEKAGVLFSWFDYSHSGMLTEVELTVFLTRTASCLSRIQVISSFEIGQADARHMALLARVKPDGSVVPEVSLERFVAFLDTNKATTTIRRILCIIDRLLFRINNLKQRIQNAHLAVEAKNASIDESHATVPRFDIINALRCHPRSMYVLWVDETSVSFAVPSNGVFDDVAYAMVSEVRVVPPLDGEGGSTHDEVHNFLAVTYHRSRLVKASSCSAASPFHRVDVLSLQPGRTYSLTLYTDTWCFPETKVSTRKTTQQLLADRQAWPEEGKEEQGGSSSSTSAGACDYLPCATEATLGGLVVLPADVGADDVQGVLEHSDAVRDCSDVIFSGTLCPADSTWKLLLQQSLKTSLLSYFHTEAAAATSRGVADHVAAAAAVVHRSTLEGELGGAVGRLWGLVSAPSYGYQGMQSWLGGKRILHVRGCTPWSSSARRAAVLETIMQLHASTRIGTPLPEQSRLRRDGDAAAATFAKVEAALEAVHDSFTAPLRLPVHTLSSGLARVLVLRSGAHAAVEEPGMSVAALTTLLLSSDTGAALSLAKGGGGGGGDARGKSGAASARMAHTDALPSSCKQCVVVARTPLDLMTPLCQWTGPTPTDVIPVVKGPKLTGAHEIKHGAYSTPADLTPSVAPVDSDFEKVVYALFAWLEATSSEPDPATHRSVDVVCCGWIGGVDVTLKRMHGASTVIIRIHCLAATRKGELTSTAQQLQGVAGVDTSGRVGGEGADIGANDTTQAQERTDVDFVLARMQASLPANVTMCVDTAASEVRAFVIPRSTQPWKVSTPVLAPVGKVSDLSKSRADSAREPVVVASGPRVVQLSHDSVTISVRTIGFGLVSCTLYELPLHCDVVDATALVISERKRLHLIRKLDKRAVTSSSHFEFEYRGLLAGTNFCVVVETESQLEFQAARPVEFESKSGTIKGAADKPPTVYELAPFVDPPAVAVFRSRAHDGASVGALLLAGVTTRDVTRPSFVVGKIARLLDSARAPPLPVYLCHQVSASLQDQAHLHSSHFSDLTQLWQRGAAVHVLHRGSLPTLRLAGRQDGYSGSQDPAPRGGCTLERSGQFVRLGARDDSPRALLDIVKAMDVVDTTKNVMGVHVVVHAPLVPFLRRHLAPITDRLARADRATGAQRYRHVGEKWMWDGLCHGRTKTAVLSLVARMLDWKRSGEGRDVVIASVLDIPYPLVATVTKRVRGEDVSLRQLLMPAYLQRHDGDKEGGYDVKEVDSFAPASPAPAGTTDAGGWTCASPEWDYVFPLGIFGMGKDMEGTVEAPKALAHEVHVQKPRLDLYRHVLGREQKYAAECRVTPPKVLAPPGKRFSAGLEYTFTHAKRPGQAEVEEVRATLAAQDAEREAAIAEADEEEAREAKGLKPMTAAEKADADAKANAPALPARFVHGTERVLPRREPLMSWVDIAVKKPFLDEGENRAVTDRADDPVTPEETALMARRRNFHFVTMRLLADPVDLIQVIAGPVVGLVTPTSARFLVELNTALKLLVAVLRPYGAGGAVVRLVEENVQAYKSVLFTSEALLQDTR